MMSNIALDPDAIAVVSDNQLSTTLSGEVVILGLHDTVYYGLQDVGTCIWELLQTPHSVRQIIDHVVSRYEVAEDTAASDLGRLLVQLQGHGLITIEQG